MIPPELEHCAREEPQALIDHVNTCITALMQTNLHCSNLLHQVLLQRSEVNNIQSRLVIEMFKKSNNLDVEHQQENANPRSSFYSSHNIFASIGKMRLVECDTKGDNVESAMETLHAATARINQVLSTLNQSGNAYKDRLLQTKNSLIKLKSSLRILKETMLGVGDDLILEDFMEDIKLLKNAALFYLEQSVNLTDDRDVFKQRLKLLSEGVKGIRAEMNELLNYEFYDTQDLLSLKALLVTLHQSNKKSIHSSLNTQYKRLVALSNAYEPFKEPFELPIKLEIKISQLKEAIDSKLKSKDTQIENWREECASMEKFFQARLCQLQEVLDKERFESETLRRNMEIMERTNRKNISRLLVDNENLQNQITELKKELINKEQLLFQEKENSLKKVEEQMKKRKVQAATKEECLIGFAGSSPSQRDELVRQATELGFSSYVGSDFSPRMTHLICPERYVSVRVLAAAISCKWLVPPEWLHACSKAGHRLPELEHGGKKHKVSPLQGQFFSITPSFEDALLDERIQKLHGFKPTIDKKTFADLMINLGKARFTAIGEGIPLVLSHINTNSNNNNNSSGDSYGEGMTWKDLIKLIMNF